MTDDFYFVYNNKCRCLGMILFYNSTWVMYAIVLGPNDQCASCHTLIPYAAFCYVVLCYVVA